MNLLTDSWIPVRPVDGGAPRQVSLKAVLCEGDHWALCLPRDDMEMAAMQLLICLVQVCWMPSDAKALQQRLRNLLTEDEFQVAFDKWDGTFQLDHTETPFMQVKGVAAKEVTPLDKLFTGLSGTTNCVHINEPGQADAICPGCAAIALFNQANNAPGFGGGFKNGLRSTAVTTLVKGSDLRSSIWFNVLHEQSLDGLMPDWRDHLEQLPTWQAPIKDKETIPAEKIGLLRGLFWQPCHIELSKPIGAGICHGCGNQAEVRYTSFLKAKFNFMVQGLWPHPHSPCLLDLKKGKAEERFLAFTTPTPSWTQVSRALVKFDVEKKRLGQKPAAVIEQYKKMGARRLDLMIGGYRNNQASIVERRHDVMSFSQGWEKHPEVINAIVTAGVEHKSALRKALYLFAIGVKNSEIKGAGVDVHEVAETEYYRQSDLLIPALLARINYDNAQASVDQLKQDLAQLCRTIFEQVTQPYAHHPKLILVLAIARRTLGKHLKELQLKGANNDHAA